MRKNILLFILALALTLLLAPYFGSFYNKFDPQYESSFWGLNYGESLYFSGLLFSYVFLIPLIFEIFGEQNKKRTISWLLLPIVLFYVYSGIKFLFIPTLAIFVAFLIARIINFIRFKIYQS